MELEEFLAQIKAIIKPVILLEGKRKVKKGDEKKLFTLSRLLCMQLQHCIFRTGNAS